MSSQMQESDSKKIEKLEYWIDKELKHLIDNAYGTTAKDTTYIFWITLLDRIKRIIVLEEFKERKIDIDLFNKRKTELDLLKTILDLAKKIWEDFLPIVFRETAFSHITGAKEEVFLENEANVTACFLAIADLIKKTK